MDEGPSIRILIGYHQGIFRDGLRKLLEAERGFKVVREASEVTEAIKAARQLRPDILLLELTTPQQAGLEALRQIESLPSPVRTLLLVERIDKDRLVQALQLGLHGVVLKQSATQHLIKGIRSVVAGQYCLGRETVGDIVSALRESHFASNGGARRRNFGLTAREMEIIGSIVAGYMNKEIAEKFSLSEQTVKHHLTNIFGKVGVSNRLELALFAVNRRLMGDS